MPVELAHAPDVVHGQTPPLLAWAWWRPVPEHAPWIVLTCGHGHVGHLDVPAVHQVAADGTVSPSCVCPMAGCDWHVWVRLQDWAPR